MQAVQDDALFDDYLMSQVLITMSVAVLVAQWTTRRKVGPVVLDGPRLPHGKQRKNKHAFRVKRGQHGYSARAYEDSPWWKTLHLIERSVNLTIFSEP